MPFDPPMLLGSLGSQGCPDGHCDAYPFEGFQDPTQKYQTVTIYDWDCCINGSAAVSGDSYGSETSPTSWEGLNGDEICCKAGCHGLGYINNCLGGYPNPDTGDCPDGQTKKHECACANPDALVDGHITYKAINNCYAVVIDGTGNAIHGQPVGTIVTIASIKDPFYWHGTVRSNTKADSLIINNHCGNSDGSKIYYVLSDPEP